MCVYGYIHPLFTHCLNLVCVNQGRTSETLTTSACRQCVPLYSHCWIRVSGVPPDDCLRQHLVGCLLPAVVSTEWTLAQPCSGCNTEVWSTSGPPLTPPPPCATTHLSTGETEKLYVCLVLFIDVVVSHRIPDLLFAVAGASLKDWLSCCFTQNSYQSQQILTFISMMMFTSQKKVSVKLGTSF